MNMNMGIQGQQYDPRFLNLFNPAINPNARMPYTMVPNTCGDGMRTIANPYDRNLYAYGVPIQFMSMNSAGYPNMGVYPSYMGIKQGVPIAPTDRSQMLPPNGDYVHQQIEKQMQSFVGAPSSVAPSNLLAPREVPPILEKKEPVSAVASAPPSSTPGMPVMPSSVPYPASAGSAPIPASI